MPTEPLVCAIMLTKDRPAMARRAVESFRAQTYERKILLAWDNGEHHLVGYPWPSVVAAFPNQIGDVRHCMTGLVQSIGKHRNDANDLATRSLCADILIHWDDDDLSHPNRIAEQVALLQSSGADCVGYNEVLFWRLTGFKLETIDVTVSGTLGGSPSPYRDMIPGMTETVGEAWLWRKTNGLPDLPGTSLCYWRRTWERLPFPNRNTGEDYEWCAKVGKVAATTSIGKWLEFSGGGTNELDNKPRIIASIHGANTTDYDLEGIIARGDQSWKRAPEWDRYCREKMDL